MDFSFKLGHFGLDISNEQDIVYCHPDMVIVFRLWNPDGWNHSVKKATKATDFIAFFCGGKRDEDSNCYIFLSRRACNHFISLIEGFTANNNPYDGYTDPPPWDSIDELDDIPW